MKDPRHQSYITYAQTDLVYLAMLKNLCSQHSMRQMEENFNEENCIAILRLLSGNEDLEEMPHCEHCLSTTHKNDDGSVTKRYYHKVLEAKLVLSDKIVIPLGTEFIENEEGVGKQDCENKAAKRLMERIKQDCMESVHKKDGTKHKKYIFVPTGKFSKTAVWTME